MDTVITTGQLSQLNPLHKLDQAGLQELANKIHIEVLPAERNLFVRGQLDSWHFYLLKGQISLSEPHQEIQYLIHTDKRACLPIRPHQPRQVTATALTEIEFIRIDKDLLELLLSQDKLPLYPVEELSEDTPDLQQQIFHRIVHDYISNQLVIPSMPELAVRITRAADDPNMDVVKLTKLLQFDAAVSARIIQVANSPLYRPETPVMTTRHAVEHLGFDITRQLAVSFILQQLYRSQSRQLQGIVRELWQCNSRIAALSFILARLAPGLNPERAFLAGILCRIGALPIALHAAHFPILFNDPNLFAITCNKLAPAISAMVLRKWGFANELITVALESDIWQRDPDRHPDYCDIVLLARLHLAISQSIYHDLPPLDSIPAFKKINAGKLSPQGSIQIIEEAREEIRELERLLNLAV